MYVDVLRKVYLVTADKACAVLVMYIALVALVSFIGKVLLFFNVAFVHFFL